MCAPSITSCPSLDKLCFVTCALLTTACPAAEITLGNLDQTYTGSPLVPSVTTVPENVPVTLLYQRIAGPTAVPASSSEIVFANTPPVLPLSFISLGFAATQTIGVGNYFRLANHARKLESCEVQLVTWARAAQYPAQAALNPQGYFHPVTITLFALTPDIRLITLTELTRNIFIPWRPEQLPDGSPYPFNGYALPARFDFPDGITLPEQVMVSVDFDTQSSGFEPIGIPGPYNALNLALDGTFPSTGIDLNADDVLWIKKEAWSYPATGFRDRSGPVLKMTATTEVTKTPPHEPGSYTVTALAGLSGTEGTTTGTLIIRQSFDSWQQREFTPAQIASGAAALDADPDLDGFTNLAEYATGSSPTIPASPITFSGDPSGISITLQRPAWVTGIQTMAEESMDLESWTPRPLEIISTSGQGDTLRASASPSALASGQAFLRFRFER